MPRSFLLLSVLLIPIPALAATQGPRQPAFASADSPAQLHSSALLPDTAAGRPDELGMALGGVLASFGGMLASGYAGCATQRCDIAEVFLAMTAGSTISTPAGVHLVNGRRGNFPRSFGASALIFLGGWVAALALDDATPVLLIPPVQVISAIAIETRTTPGVD